MKKKLLGLGAIFAGALLLTGCGGSNTYTCSVTYTEGDESMTQKIVAYLDKDDKVESYDIVMEMASEESAEGIYQLYQSMNEVTVSKSGKTVTIKDANKIEDSEVDIIGKTKDEIKSFVQASEPNATCK